MSEAIFSLDTLTLQGWAPKYELGLFGLTYFQDGQWITVSPEKKGGVFEVPCSEQNPTFATAAEFEVWMRAQRADVNRIYKSVHFQCPSEGGGVRGGIFFVNYQNLSSGRYAELLHARDHGFLSNETLMDQIGRTDVQDR